MDEFDDLLTRSEALARDANTPQDGRDGEPGPPGPEGPAGRDGQDGKDALTPVVNVNVEPSPVAVQVNVPPSKRGAWLMTVTRDENGFIQSILSTPVEPNT